MTWSIITQNVYSPSSKFENFITFKINTERTIKFIPFTSYCNPPCFNNSHKKETFQANSLLWQLKSNVALASTYLCPPPPTPPTDAPTRSVWEISTCIVPNVISPTIPFLLPISKFVSVMSQHKGQLMPRVWIFRRPYFSLVNYFIQSLHESMSGAILFYIIHCQCSRL